jgi:hypothetical protein
MSIGGQFMVGYIEHFGTCVCTHRPIGHLARPTPGDIPTAERPSVPGKT